jgi:hypothetical protein
MHIVSYKEVNTDNSVAFVALMTKERRTSTFYLTFFFVCQME